MQTITKLKEDGITYLVRETRDDDGTLRATEQIKADPWLRFQPPPAHVNLGDAVEIALHAEDFDGEPRTDLSRTVTFIISGTSIDAGLVAGELTLSIEFFARGKHLIRIVPAEINMEPFTVEVV